MRACQACHRSKVKCDRHEVIPCSRCERLGIECVEHVSRQGQGSRKKKVRTNNNGTISVGREKTSTLDPIECAVIDSTSKLGPNHYGIHYLIRSWVSYAMTRRSFGLLNKASQLACRCSISMDQILSGENKFAAEETGLGGVRKMNFLSSVVSEPSSSQRTAGGPLQLVHLPERLLHACDFFHIDPASPRHLDNRWVFIREMTCGTSRFYTSAAFSRDIASWESIQKTWQENKQQVKDLWLPRDEYRNYTQGFIHQISLHNAPNVPPNPTRMPPTKIMVRTGHDRAPAQLIEAEYAICIDIVNLDCAFIYVEYMLPFRPILPATVSNHLLEPLDVSSGQDNDFENFLEGLNVFGWNHEKNQVLETVETSVAQLFSV